MYSEYGYEPAVGELISAGGVEVTGSKNRVVYKRPTSDAEPRGRWGRCGRNIFRYRRSMITNTSERRSNALAWAAPIPQFRGKAAITPSRFVYPQLAPSGACQAPCCNFPEIEMPCPSPRLPRLIIHRTSSCLFLFLTSFSYTVADGSDSAKDGTVYLVSSGGLLEAAEFDVGIGSWKVRFSSTSQAVYTQRYCAGLWTVINTGSSKLSWTLFY